MTNPMHTHACFVLDRSGSMFTIARDMDGAVKQLLRDQAPQPGTIAVDIITFDTEVEYPYTGVRPDDVKGDLIVPRGGTALNDALAGAIVSLGEQFARMPDEDRPGHVIVVVATDGQENSSVEYKGREGTERVKQMVELQKEKYGWEFLFLSAGPDAFGAAEGYGVGRGQTMSFAASGAGTQSVVATASAYMMATRGGHEYEITDEEREEALKK